MLWQISTAGIITGLENSRRILLTDQRASTIHLGKISEDLTFLGIIRRFQPHGIKVLVFGFVCSQDALAITDVDQQSPPAVDFITVENDSEKISFHSPKFSFKFPFDICQSNGFLFVIDNERHCDFKLLKTTQKKFLFIVPSLASNFHLIFVNQMVSYLSLIMKGIATSNLMYN